MDPLWEVVGCEVLCGFRALRFRVKGVAVPVVLHVVLQGTLRNVKGVAVPVALHVVLQGTLRNVRGVAVPVILHAVHYET